MYRPGDRVIYTATKHSAHPGRRAEAVEPEPHGEGYSYAVKKYWLVVGVEPGGLLLIVTRRGKQRAIAASDPRLRHAHWWESLLFGSRFPHPPPSASAGQSSSGSRPSLSA
jgi:hypothetical protein